MSRLAVKQAESRPPVYNLLFECALVICLHIVLHVILPSPNELTVSYCTFLFKFYSFTIQIYFDHYQAIKYHILDGITSFELEEIKWRPRIQPLSYDT